MRDRGHVAPAAAPAVFVPPALVRIPPRSPHTRSHPLHSPRVRTYPPAHPPHAPLVPAHSCARLYRPRCSIHTPCAHLNPVRSPRARSYPPAHVRSPRASLVAAAAIAAAAVRTPSPASWFVCASPALAFLSVVPYL